MKESPLADGAALHIVSLLVECFDLRAGMDVTQEMVRETFESQGWEKSDYKLGEQYALKNGWLKAHRASVAGRVRLQFTAAGYKAAKRGVP